VKYVSTAFILIALLLSVSCSRSDGTYAGKADIDLTSMSSTMAYSMVVDMDSNPIPYIGKTVKMTGRFATTAVQETGKRYFGCIIMDATACCGQTIEFELGGKHSFPEDYPDPGTDVTVIGVFNTYEEHGYTYCTLRNAELVAKTV